MLPNELVIRQEIERYKLKFAEENLDLSHVFGYPAASQAMELRALRRLWDLVCAYRICPNPTKLMKLGFDYPPMHPDIEPRTDWLRFGRWINRQPLTWNYVKLHGPLIESAQLTDDQLTIELDRLIERLAENGVVIDPLSELPDRMIYEYLETELKTREFLYLAPGTWCHIGPRAETGRIFNHD